MTAPNVFQSVLDMKTGIDSNVNDAAQIAINAQQALQQIQNNEASGNTSVFSWDTVFSGTEGTSLNGTDFSASTGIKIRGNNGFVGIDSSVGNGFYRGDIAYPYLTSNQSASVVIGSIDEGSTAIDYLLIQCDTSRTEGAYLYIYKDNLRVGKFTRSGGTYTFNTPLVSVGATLKSGSIIRFYNTGNTYYVKVNNIQKIGITDSSNTITRDASHVYSSFLMERNSFLYVGDGPRFASFAMSDDIAGGVPVSDSWLVTRSSTSAATLAVANGSSALMPSSFFATQNYLVGSTMDTLGIGKIKIENSDWYQLSCSTIGLVGDGVVASLQKLIGLPWAVYVNGAQITGPIPCGGAVDVYLNKNDLVQPMVVASVPSIPSTSSAGSSGSNSLAGDGAIISLRGFSSWMGKRIS